ncbi:type II toxin-antitoxin system HicA family toxin [Kribbella shirazensis]|uniref:Putative RNA binding protein YcfA (HicA-like mRNA interferase family) n=1 Tax=Kribbella shirazensis TaxID=1105143 RepID=A0A7X5VB49_9ACTN|nr:type II toxin-antitoxin system HicA family toxin [Kribbella shirazensis]NIK57868.1 putative RNA binding protein YcfA (HicA-like mRNA interferase family) [Kribbella shirazensis]
MAGPKRRKEAESELKGQGFKKIPGRGKGSHEVWQDDSGKTVTVPNHGKEIAAGTWRSIAKAAGIRKSRPLRTPDVESVQRLANDGVARPGTSAGPAAAPQARPATQPGQQAVKRTGRASTLGGD